MNIKVRIVNALNGEVIVDHSINVDSTSDIIAQNHQVMAHAYPDCHVNFEMDNGDFIYGIPVNMERDEVELSFEDYCAKWYPGVLAMEKQDWDERDSFSY
jgi:hypothetical protein